MSRATATTAVELNRRRASRRLPRQRGLRTVSMRSALQLAGLSHKRGIYPSNGASAGGVVEAVHPATLRVPGRARWGVSGSLNPKSAPCGAERRPRGGVFGTGSSHAVLTDRVPRTGSVRTASGPEGSSAKDSLSGAAVPPDPSWRRGYLRGRLSRRRSAWPGFSESIPHLLESTR